MVKIWNESVEIPTYEVGSPEKNPMFLEKRVYQGSSGVVYPYPVIEKIASRATPKTYNALYLENDYLKIMILPELGGRVQMAYDKIAERHFIYYNSVVKPALVGLTGPWISGGIEFNWPQHHRPSTFMPIDYTTEQGADGSVTVWVGERERMFGQKAAAGFTLRPGSAVLEIHGRLFNPTPQPATFLWWANPAVKVNEHYQSVFPSDVNAVFDHGKRDVSEYPIARGTYYKVDYSAGVDISRYSNIPVPTSYMAVESKYDFVGGYENDTRAGVLHVSNHHLSPGKKQWTWGNGDFGTAWDRNLTDADGPYIELMTGVFTDNQPDFAWMEPYENKSFVQYFMPYRELGVVKNASRELLLNIESDNFKLFATQRLENIRVTVRENGQVRFDTTITISPEQVYEQPLEITDFDHVEIAVYRPSGAEMLSWSPDPTLADIPQPAVAADLPADIDSIEELYLTGLHIEQYRHATYRAEDYYLEALRREPGNAQCNNAMGRRYLKQGCFSLAETHLRRAVETLTARNPNPENGEPLYNLGIALKYQGKDAEAYKAFYKACWNGAWQCAAYLGLAQISTSCGEFEKALSEVGHSLLSGWHNHTARHLKIALLRHLGRQHDAVDLIDESLRIDPFNFGALFERSIIDGGESLESTVAMMRHDSHNYETLALDYAAAGLYNEAIMVLDAAPNLGPMTYYYKGWALACRNLQSEAKEIFMLAEAQDMSCCFPNRVEAIAALECAMQLNPDGARAPYLLGCLLYDKRRHDSAIEMWERAVELDATFPTAHRNLALGYFNKRSDAAKAREHLEAAFALDHTDARVLMELDQLYKRLNVDHADRLGMLQRHRGLVDSRDDLYLEYVTLLNQSGRYPEAIALLDARTFHPWEGGEGKVPAQYQYARVELSKQKVARGEYDEALQLIEQCYHYPHNMGEGKLPGAIESDFDYYRGVVLDALGRRSEARESFLRATHCNIPIAAAIFYNDQKPDKIYYKGLALMELGRNDEASAIFRSLVDYGTEHMDDACKIDYFAVSLPDLLIWEDDLPRRNRIHCHYLMALGYCGLGDRQRCAEHLEQAAAMDNNHQGVASLKIN